MIAERFLMSVRLAPADGDEPRSGYPWHLAAVAALAAGVELHPKVTYLIGENGSGKSTLLEAIRLARGIRRPRTDFLLRAKSLFTAAIYLERLPASPSGADPLAADGGRSLHEQSHGESFLAVLVNRLGPDGLYLFDD